MRWRQLLVWAICAWIGQFGFGIDGAQGAPQALAVPAGNFLGDDGGWTAFSFEVGSPAQSLSLLPSTSSSQLLLQIPGGCPATIANCATSRGGLYNSGTSTAWQQVGEGNVTLEQRFDIRAPAIFGTETVSINSATLKEQTVAEIDAIEYWVGSVGLHIWDNTSSAANTDQTDFISSLKEQDIIPSLTFAYTAGAPYRLKGALGSLTLGGYDASRFDPGSVLYVDFADDPVRDLVIKVDAINTTINGTTSGLTVNAFTAFIDTTVTDIWLPESACKEWENQFGITWNSTGSYYTINSTQQAAVRAANPNITFTLADPNQGPSREFVLPYAAFDLTASWPRYNDYPNSISYFPLRRASTLQQITLGRAFFQEAHLLVSFENGTYQLAQTVFSSASPELVSIYPNGTTSSTGNSGSNAGAGSSGASSSGGGSSSSGPNASVIGPAVGVPVGVLALAAVAGFLWYRRRRQQRAAHSRLATASAASTTDEKQRDSYSPSAAKPPPRSRDELATGIDHEIYEVPTAITPFVAASPVVSTPRSELHGDTLGRAELAGSPGHEAVEVSSIPSPTFPPPRNGNGGNGGTGAVAETNSPRSPLGSGRPLLNRHANSS